MGPAKNRNGHVGGTADKLTYDFLALDQIMKGLQDAGVQLLASYGYTPAPLKDAALTQRRDTTPPMSAGKFSEAVAAFARH